MRLPVLFFVALLTASSCAPRYLNYEMGLEKNDDLLVSDLEAPSDIKRLSDHDIESRFTFLAQNRGKQPVTIEGGHASLSFASFSYQQSCEDVTSHSDAVIVQPGALVRLICVLKITSDENNSLAQRDASATLDIPFKAEVEKHSIRFKIFLRAEDFKQ